MKKSPKSKTSPKSANVFQLRYLGAAIVEARGIRKMERELGIYNVRFSGFGGKTSASAVQAFRGGICIARNQKVAGIITRKNAIAALEAAGYIVAA